MAGCLQTTVAQDTFAQVGPSGGEETFSIKNKY